MDDRKAKIRGIVPVLAFFAAMGAAALLLAKPLAAFWDRPEAFRNWIESRGTFGKAAFVGAVALQVIVAVIPGEPFEIFAGYAFGAVQGAVLCLLGTTLGGALVFILVKRFGKAVARVFFDEEKIRSLSFLSTEKRRNAVLFLVFFLPGTPKDLLTYAAGLTPVRLRSFLLITFVARIPSIITSTVGGGAISEKRYLFAVAVFVLTAAVSGLGLAVYNRFADRRKKNENKEISA